MVRIKLFTLDKKLSVHDILRCIEKWNSRNESKVINIDDVNDNLIIEYKERVVKSEEYELVDGSIQTIELVSYFNFQVGFPLGNGRVAYLVNPPRESRYTYELLRSMLSDYTKISPAAFNLNAFLSKKTNSSKVLGVTISNIQYSNEILAKTTLLSKTDLVEYYDTWIVRYPHSVDVLKLSIDGKVFDINRLGGIKAKDADLHKIIPIIYNNFEFIA